MPGFSNDSINSPYAIQILDDPLAFEFVQDFSGGEDSFRRSTLIDGNQCQHLLNVIVRDNYEARTRPGADSIPVAKTPPVAGATGVFSMRYYDTPSHEQLLASVAVGNTAHILKFESGAWADLTLPSGWPAASDDRLAMEQGVDKMLISDGTGIAYIWDGANFTAADTITTAHDNAANPAQNCPIGATIFSFFQGVMWAAGVSTATDTLWFSYALNFNATGWDNTLRSFRVGSGDGDPIVALAPLQGSTMAILKRDSVHLVTYNAAADAGGSTAINAFTDFQPLSYGIGCVGRDAWCAYGNDILFMAQDGIRSVQRMQAAAGQWQLTAPLSQPVQPYIARINQSAWDKIVGFKYQEFAGFFVPLDNSTTNNYLLVYNGRLQKWLGAWTNWNSTCVEVTRFNGKSQLVFGDIAGLVNQWKDLSPNQDDDTYLDNGVGYPTQVWTRSFQFQEAINNKTAYNTVLRFSAGNAALSLGWYADTVLAKTWNGNFNPTGDILGVGQLPFLLESTAPSKVTKGIRGLPAFNEAYVSIQSQTGWFWLKNIAASAFVNPMKEMS